MVFGTDYTYNKLWHFQTKIQYNGFRVDSVSKGFAFIQDIETKIKRVQLKTRIAYFNTNTYDSRIYAYENDVLYAVSFPAYNGTGFRYYVISKFPITRNLDAWVRFSQTNVSSSETLSSGNDELQFNRKSDLKIQLKYNF